MKSIKIGTRNSPLALWQSREVARNLQNFNHTTEITPMSSAGDHNLEAPLYEMGITGVFTKVLDMALLKGEVDLAVHSLKDVPTKMPKGLKVFAYLKRDFPQDVLVRNPEAEALDLKDLKIATSSLRRRAFWLREFPQTEFVDIRGNVNTRLQKIKDGLADATLFSLAGLKRLNINIKYEFLPFMISAPAQGVVVVVGRESDLELQNIFENINHTDTQKCVEVERSFLQKLEGGCTAPIGAFSELVGSQMRFVGRLCSLDGQNCIESDDIFEYHQNEDFGAKFAKKILENGGQSIMESIKP